MIKSDDVVIFPTAVPNSNKKKKFKTDFLKHNIQFCFTIFECYKIDKLIKYVPSSMQCFFPPSSLAHFNR